MNILIPMAGEGSRLDNHSVIRDGHNCIKVPKPLIHIKGECMIKRCIESLGFNNVSYIFITKKYRYSLFNDQISKLLPKNSKQITVEKTTKGPACSALLAKELIDNNEPLIIANCDQIMRWDSLKFIDYINRHDYDGIVVTYTSNVKKNSYAKINLKREVVEIKEKEVISNISLNGIHYWKHGSLFVSSAEYMIKNNMRTNNEFYIGPSYNQLIKNGKKIGIYHIPKDQHFAVGTKEDVEKYENLQNV